MWHLNLHRDPQSVSSDHRLKCTIINYCLFSLCPLSPKEIRIHLHTMSSNSMTEAMVEFWQVVDIEMKSALEKCIIINN